MPETKTAETSHWSEIWRRARASSLTHWLLCLNLVGALVPLLHSGASHSFTMIESGANYAPLTLTGDHWRLLSSLFLHGGVIHLGLNMLMLIIIGPIYEAYWGGRRAWLLYLASGMLAALASALWYGNRQVTQTEWVFMIPIQVSGIQPVVSMGASGALMGLIGSHFGAVLAKQFNRQVREIQGASLKEDACVVGSTLIFGLLIPAMDNAAHLFGWLSGGMIGLLWAQSEQRPGLISRGAEGLIIALMLVLLISPFPQSWASQELRSYREAYWPAEAGQYERGAADIHRQ
ncbi:membrane associated rhomboid family serine protease [Chitinivorax tropicus]|uniref:Membrane associated rhomboid family serine protease n=1 Tax=Chitinivorax tropicus TaxID=714531 RepID=A0A840MQ17_9PROT|nr:membrane associated rhomboid family serine protease [Chitinivorax tropicus]